MKLVPPVGEAALATHGPGPLVQEVTSVALTFERKKAVVTEVAEVAKGALSAIAAEYRGLSVEPR